MAISPMRFIFLSTICEIISSSPAKCLNGLSKTHINPFAINFPLLNQPLPNQNHGLDSTHMAYQLIFPQPNPWECVSDKLSSTYPSLSQPMGVCFRQPPCVLRLSSSSVAQELLGWGRACTPPLHLFSLHCEKPLSVKLKSHKKALHKTMRFCAVK